MEKVNVFYQWFKGLGGETQAMKIDEVSTILNEPTFIVSTLKPRAEEIKTKYNHKFN